VTAVATLAGPTHTRPVRHVEHVMGMPISLALRGRHVDDPVARGAWADVLADLDEVDRVFSTYRDDSYVSRLDRGEITLTDCPPEVTEVLELGERARQLSEGAFDIRHRRPDGRVVLDPSGVVKGWAVERASAWLHALPETDFCLSAGGDMVCHTSNPDGRPWRIGIENPADPQRLLGSVPIWRGAIATSGTAHRAAHIVDARTGDTPRHLASVTVIADSLTWADIDATAAYARDGEAARWLRGRPGRTAVVVWADGRIEQIA
jgi:thiamine biosynthesis lipoprotein